MEGWIKLHRKISENGLWQCEPFTRGQAWVDLLLLASHQKTFFYVRGIKINLERGQLAWSETKLADRWKWSRTKLRKFLNDMEKEQQIIQQKGNVIQIVTVVNYDNYQQKEQQSGQQKNNRKTTEEQQKDTYKNEKKEKELIEFKEKALGYSNEYSEEMVKEFIDYWTEENPTKTKYRFQMEKTWSIERRLATWHKRSTQYKPESKGLYSGYKDSSFD